MTIGERRKMFRVIHVFVLAERKRRGIFRENLGYERKPELSGEMFGEFQTLIETQLLYTVENWGGWKELNISPEANDRDDAVLQGTYEEVLRLIGLRHGQPTPVPTGEFVA